MADTTAPTETAHPHFDEGVRTYASGELEESLRHFSEAIDAGEVPERAYVSRGAAYLRLERPEAALADFDQALSLAPDQSRTHHLRGLAKAQLHDDDAALAAFNRAIELDPEYGTAYYSRSTLQNRRGNEAAAMEDIQTYTHLTEKRLQEFGNENNIWRSQQLHLEAENIADVMSR